MKTSPLPPDCLVLYKNRPARLIQQTDRLEIEILSDSGATDRLRVRPKDVVLLHPGPVGDIRRLLQTPPGEIETAWEVLQASQFTLEELALLAYGEFSPTAAWAACQHLMDGTFFSGSPQEMRAKTPLEVQQERQARALRSQGEAARLQALERIRSGQAQPADRRWLDEIEAFALGRPGASRLLKDLGLPERAESAHEILLRNGVWTALDNPHPRRLGVALLPPEEAVPALPEFQREDLTRLPAYAIDDEGNQEPDDALSLDEGWLWVHIADACALAPPGSPLDEAARSRGCSVYLPEGTVPMLPPAAVEILGLGLQEVSPALSFKMRLDSAGNLVDYYAVRTWVRVQRLTYAQAEDMLDKAPFNEILQLCRTSQARRERAGAVMMDFPEVSIKVIGGQVRIDPISPLNSREMVREAMILAGEAAARLAQQSGLAVPFASQEASPVSAVLPGLAGAYALRRQARRGSLSLSPAPHAGLGLAAYTRVTSPLRRYHDLLVHQQLCAALDHAAPLSAAQVLERSAAAEAAASAASEAESLSRRHWTLVYLLQNPAWRGKGVVVDKMGSRARLLIPDLALESFVVLTREADLNDEIELKVMSIDLPRLDVLIHPAD